MNELLGWYGYDKLDSTESRALNLKRYASSQTATSSIHTSSDDSSSPQFDTFRSLKNGENRSARKRGSKKEARPQSRHHEVEKDDTLPTKLSATKRDLEWRPELRGAGVGRRSTPANATSSSVANLSAAHTSGDSNQDEDNDHDGLEDEAEEAEGDEELEDDNKGS